MPIIGDVEYKTVGGFVYAGIWEKVVGGKKLREFMISDALNGDQVVRVTVWPSHESTDVAIGDFIIANGKYEIFDPGQDKETGEFVTPDKVNHSVSVNKFINVGGGLGTLQKGKPHNASIPKQRLSADEIPGL